MESTNNYLSKQESALISETAAVFEEKIGSYYLPGFGICPTSRPDDYYFNQVWIRDASLAAYCYFVENNPEAVMTTLKTIFSHQRSDGALPFRVEREYLTVKMIPLIGKWIAGPLFRLMRNGKERPVYEGQENCGAADTVPTAIIAAGDLFLLSNEYRQFVADHFEHLKKAMDFFIKKTDPADGLAFTQADNPDWADSIRRKGKLGNINIWWAISLKVMETISENIGHNTDAANFQSEYAKVKQGLMEKLFDRSGGYFRAKAGKDRLDTAACVFGSLFFLDPVQAAGVQENLKRRVRHGSGLKNFDPPYPVSQIDYLNILTGNGGYHNKFVWPWVAGLNIQVKIKIALEHPDQVVREQYKKESIGDLSAISVLYKNAGGAYEVFLPDEPKLAGSWFYRPPRNFLGSLVTYLAAYNRMKKLGWI